MAGSRFGSHIKWWFFLVPLLALVVMPAIPDKSLFSVPPEEADSVQTVVGAVRADEVVNLTNARFRRWFVDSEDEVPETCPCGGRMLRRCPACDAPFSSTFAVDCEVCLSQFLIHFVHRPMQRAIAAAGFVQHAKFTQIGPHVAFDASQRLGGGREFGVCQIDGFAQFGNQALCLLIAQFL